MELALVIAVALVLVLGPFALAIFVSELGKVRENRYQAQRAHERIDGLEEKSLPVEKKQALQQERQEQAARDEENRSFYEYGGC